MAKISLEGLDGVSAMLSKLGDVPFEVLSEALDAMGDAGAEAVRSAGEAMGVRDPRSDTHILDHVIHTKPKQTEDGAVSYVTFSGSRTRGKTKSRNAEIAFVNEYGKRGQAARPFIRQAAEQYAEQISTPGEKIIGDWQEKTFSTG